MAFNWTCPYCNSKTTIGVDNHYVTEEKLDIENSEGYRLLQKKWIVCPNEDCHKITLTLFLFEYVYNEFFTGKGKLIKSWRLLPESDAKVFPDYIPEPLRNDYIEASKIRDLSPKASATLSRRCLQGTIRDFWQVSKSRLVDEIVAIEDKVDPLTWKAIDSVRKVGNIGAHMEKDINLIIDVDPDEASILLQLIELLFEEWYIHRYEREQKMNAIVALAGNKDSLKQGSTSAKP